MFLNEFRTISKPVTGATVSTAASPKKVIDIRLDTFRLFHGFLKKAAQSIQA